MPRFDVHSLPPGRRLSPASDTLLPLNDGLYAFQATVVHLTRLSLYRCLQRYRISRLPEMVGDKPVLGKVDGGVRFANHAHRKYAFHHIFDRVCDENGI